MDKYIWIFPILFIFHDMEEVIWLPGFIKNNREDIIKRYPIAEKLLSVYKNGMTTEAFALAVYEELVVLIAVCALNWITKAEWAMGIWYGAFIGFTAHLVIHILQSIAIKRYIPSFVTSIMTLPPSIMLLINTKWDMSIYATMSMIIGIVGVAANLKLAHMLMGWYDIRLKRRDQIRRIHKYEKIMHEAESMIEDPSEDETDSLCEKIKELEAYYGSEDWKQDFSDDEAGLLPPDLNRGVLSEDGVYDLLEKYKEYQKMKA